MGGCASSGPVILGIGNPLLDIQAEFDESELARYGLHPGEAVLYDSEKQGSIYEDIKARPDVIYVPGGATQNSMRVAAALSSQPNWVSYMGCTGCDEEAEIMRQAAVNAGVHVVYQTHKTERTGVCACLIDRKTRDRVMCTRLAAACCFDVKHLEANWSLVEQAKVVYSAGFFVSSSPESMLKVARYLAPHADKFWACGINAEFIATVFTDQVKEWIKYANLFVANEMEWPALGKALGWEDDMSERDMVLKICEDPAWECHPSKPRIIIATRGPRPTLVAYRATHASKIRIEEYPVPPISQELIVDANGCGDAFVGGFLFAWSKQLPLEKCVEVGQLCARELLQRQGNQFDLRDLRNQLMSD